MKTFLVICLTYLGMSLGVAAEPETAPEAKSTNLTSTIYFSSNYIYRGISVNNTSPGGEASAGDPTLQASLDYMLGGLKLTMFTGQITTVNFSTFAFEKDNELDFIANYDLPLLGDNFIVGAYAGAYTYFRNRSNNMNEYNAHAIIFQLLRLEISQIPDYIGSGSSLTYSKASLILPVKGPVYLMTHIGYSKWGDENKVFTSNYKDYKAGIGYNQDGVNVELYYTNTIGRQNLTTGEVAKIDNAVTIGVSKTFNLF